MRQRNQEAIVCLIRISLATLMLLFAGATRIRAATITYTEDNTTGVAQVTTCGGVALSASNFNLVLSGATTGTISTGNIAAGSSISYNFSHTVGLTSWDSGNWVTGVNVSTAGSGVQWTTTCVFRINSGGVLQATVGSLTGQTTDMGSTGLKTHTVSGASQTALATDLVQVVVVFKNTNAHGNASISFTIGTSGNGETVATPIVIPAPSSQVIMITRLLDFLGPKRMTGDWQRP